MKLVPEFSKNKRGPAPHRVLMVALALAVLLAIQAFALNQTSPASHMLGASEPEGGLPWPESVSAPLGLSEEVNFPWDTMVTEKYSWRDVRDVLKKTPKYEDGQLVWLAQYRTENPALVQGGIELLMEEATLREAEEFLRWIYGLRDVQEQNQDSGEDTPVYNGLESSKNELHKALRTVKQRAQNGEEGDWGLGVENFTKEVTPAEKFRTYTVTLELTPKEIYQRELDQVSDIIFLVDTSSSMGSDNLDHAQLLSKVLGYEILSGDSPHRIGVVAYNEKGHVASGFTSSPGQIEQSITRLSAGGLANMQAGVLEAEKLFVQSDRGAEQVLFHFTDGQVDKSITDTQGYVYNTGNTLIPGSKRWTYAAYSDTGAIVPVLETPNWGAASSLKDISQKVGILESQRLAGQGVRTFVIDYSQGASRDLLEESTFPLTTTIPLNYSSRNPEQTRKNNPLGNHSWGSGNGELVGSGTTVVSETVLDKISNPLTGEQLVYNIVDSYNTELFQLVSKPENTVDRVKTAQNQLGWEIRNNNGETNPREITYELQLKDEVLLPQGVGEEEGAILSELHTLEYSWGTDKLLYEYKEPIKVAVAPLLQGEISVLNASGTPIEGHTETREVQVTATLTGGTGEYTYQLLHNEAVVKEQTVTLSGEIPTVTVEETLKDLPNGSHVFEWVLTDLKATQGGYKAEGVASLKFKVEAKVYFGKVIVEITGLDVPVEALITKAYLGQEEQWTVLGRGRYEMEAAAGTTFMLDGYVPPGYHLRVDTALATLSESRDEITLTGEVVPQPTAFFTDFVGALAAQKAGDM